MTRKDYERIARALRKTLGESDEFDPWHVAVATAANNIADELQADNPLFNRGKFFDAVEAP